MELKIGMLSIHSKAVPAMSRNYSNGMRLALDKYDFDVKFIVEGVGSGTDPKALADKAQKLVLQENVHVITGLLGHVGINELRTFAEANETALIASDMGATLPVEETRNTWSFSNSADYWHSAWMFGQRVTGWGHSEIGLASCYYDSGYGMVDGLERGLYDAKGAFSGHFITPFKPRQNEAELLGQFYEDLKPDAIFAINSGLFADEFCGFLADSGLAGTVPLFSLYENAAPHVLEKHGKTLEGMKVVSSWAKSLDVPGNKAFIAEYQEEHEKDPDFFAVLGYETGLTLGAAVKSLDKPKVTNNSLRKAISTADVQEGPRGAISFDAELRRFIPDHHLLQVAQGDDGGFELQYLENLGHSKGIVLEISNMEDDNKRGGWFNPYLCH